MTATDELRRLLDERGIEYSALDESRYRFTAWKSGGLTYQFDENDKEFDFDDTELRVFNATPEQAIAATLGNTRAERTCRMELTDLSSGSAYGSTAAAGIRAAWPATHGGGMEMHRFERKRNASRRHGLALLGGITATATRGKQLHSSAGANHCMARYGQSSGGRGMAGRRRCKAWR